MYYLKARRGSFVFFQDDYRWSPRQGRGIRYATLEMARVALEHERSHMRQLRFDDIWIEEE